MKKLHSWVLRLLPFLASIVSGSTIDILPVMKTSGTLEKHVWCSAEEHSENVIWVELVFTELICIPLLEILFCTMFIIDLSFLRITKANECSTYLLKGITSIWGSIFVWVEFQSKFLISLLYFFFTSRFCQSQNLIIVFFSDYGLATINLFVELV